DVGVPQAVHRDARGAVLVVAAQDRAIEELPGGAELRDGGVLALRRRGQAGDVGVPGRVHRDVIPLVPVRVAEVGRVHYRGIDDHRLAGVVRSQRETELVGAIAHVAHADVAASGGQVLI